MKNTIQYELYIHVNGANPNGDPNNGGRPRLDNNGYGVICQYCLKKKIRKAAEMIVKVYPDKYDPDKFGIFLSERDGLTKVEKTENEYKPIETSQVEGKGGKNAKKDDKKNQKVWPVLRDKFWDLRVFGELGNAFSGQSEQVSCGVSVPEGRSIDTVEDKITDIPFTSSVPHGVVKKGKGGADTADNAEGDGEEGGKGEKVTGKMGTLSMVSNSLYKFLISISPSGCERNMVTDLDLELFERALCNPFIDDLSNTRPSGTMSVAKLYKITHPSPLRTAASMTSATLGDDGKTYNYSIDTEMLEKRGCTIEEIDTIREY